MKIIDLHNDSGQPSGFEVSNMLVSRWRACRIARDIPGVRMLKWPKRWAWSDAVFGEFEYEGTRFQILEPFDDNDCYWIVAEPPVSAGALAPIRAAYAAAGPIDWRLGAAG
jgi:hypothetical protein